MTIIDFVYQLNHNSYSLYYSRPSPVCSLSQIILSCTCNQEYNISDLSVQAGRRGSDRYVDSVSLREPGVGTNVHTARAVRTEMSKEEVTAANVRNASTLTLLRIRARNIRSVYERLWRCHVDGDKVPFLYASKEGDGDDDDDARVKELLDYLAQDVRVIEDLRAKVERSPRSKAAWKKCNKGGGFRRRMFLERDAVVVQELSLIEQEEANGARALKASTGVERSALVVLYTKQYAADVACLQREMDAEDHGIVKPSQGEKLVIACGNTYERGHMAVVASVDASIALRQATRRAARNGKKERKAGVAPQLIDYAFNNRTPDPLYDDKRSKYEVADRILHNLEFKNSIDRLAL